MARAGQEFSQLGFNATAIDDLIGITGLQRGSLYKAFGSKRGLFIQSLLHFLGPGWHTDDTSLNLMIVAMKELSGKDPEIRQICLTAIEDAWNKDLMNASHVFGQQLLKNLEKNA